MRLKTLSLPTILCAQFDFVPVFSQMNTRIQKYKIFNSNFLAFLYSILADEKKGRFLSKLFLYTTLMYTGMSKGLHLILPGILRAICVPLMMNVTSLGRYLAQHVRFWCLSHFCAKAYFKRPMLTYPRGHRSKF